jgi:hypothetical protein
LRPLDRAGRHEFKWPLSVKVSDHSSFHELAQAHIDGDRDSARADGCDAAANIGRMPEEQIDEVRLVRPETLQTRSLLEQTLASDAAVQAELQQELATRDQVRALTCAGR